MRNNTTIRTARASFVFILALLLSIAFSTSAKADVVSVLTTGFNGTSILSPGSVDPNWTVKTPSGSTFGSTFVLTPNGHWVTSTDAAWIGPTSDSGTTNQPFGDYVYRFVFNLTSNMTDAILFGQFSTDDLPNGATLNGHALSIAFTDDGFNDGFHTAFKYNIFTNNQGFFNFGGANVLEIVVHNKLFNEDNTPTGLMLRGSVQATPTSVPEPSTGLMLLSAFSLAGLLKFKSVLL